MVIEITDIGTIARHLIAGRPAPVDAWPASNRLEAMTNLDLHRIGFV